MKSMQYEDSEDIQKYIWCMTEIKLRTEVLENIFNGKNSTGQRLFYRIWIEAI
jgi:hypothetical protein